MTTRPGKKLLAHDRKLGCRFLAGCDEAGRGSLAGPIVAAAVILDLERLIGPDAAPFGRLDDSKKLSVTQRESLYRTILRSAKQVSVSMLSSRTIDKAGLHVCNLRVMRQALSQLDAPCERILVDGFALDDVTLASGEVLSCERIVKGDATSAAVAAAAIIAKVTRDRLMRTLDNETGKLWAFSEHMGYATSLHSELIQKHGVTPHHRMSYQAKAYIGAKRADPAHAL